jgi:alkaline phosphatase
MLAAGDIQAKTREQPEGPKKYPASMQGVKTTTKRPPRTSPKRRYNGSELYAGSDVPILDETHGGEDVAIFATGVNSYLIHGSMEERIGSFT